EQGGHKKNVDANETCDAITFDGQPCYTNCVTNTPKTCEDGGYYTREYVERLDGFADINNGKHINFMTAPSGAYFTCSKIDYKGLTCYNCPKTCADAGMPVEILGDEGNQFYYLDESILPMTNKRCAFSRYSLCNDYGEYENPIEGQACTISSKTYGGKSFNCYACKSCDSYPHTLKTKIDYVTHGERYADISEQVSKNCPDGTYDICGIVKTETGSNEYNSYNYTKYKCNTCLHNQRELKFMHENIMMAQEEGRIFSSSNYTPGYGTNEITAYPSFSNRKEVSETEHARYVRKFWALQNEIAKTCPESLVKEVGIYDYFGYCDGCFDENWEKRRCIVNYKNDNFPNIRKCNE
ncbi:MAG: hypothetical protein PHE89_08275, partial [Alphaproteobacteria bacterium]|nr:hypothetical protein [Alphaproteobacteria bacterium]